METREAIELSTRVEAILALIEQADTFVNLPQQDPNTGVWIVIHGREGVSTGTPCDSRAEAESLHRRIKGEIADLPRARADAKTALLPLLPLLDEAKAVLRGSQDRKTRDEWQRLTHLRGAAYRLCEIERSPMQDVGANFLNAHEFNTIATELFGAGGINRLCHELGMTDRTARRIVAGTEAVGTPLLERARTLRHTTRAKNIFSALTATLQKSDARATIHLPQEIAGQIPDLAEYLAPLSFDVVLHQKK